MASLQTGIVGIDEMWWSITESLQECSMKISQGSMTCSIGGWIVKLFLLLLDVEINSKMNYHPTSTISWQTGIDFVESK